VLFLQRHWGIEHFDGEDVIWMGSLLQGGPYRSRGPVFGLWLMPEDTGSLRVDFGEVAHLMCFCCIEDVNRTPMKICSIMLPCLCRILCDLIL
jgi:hypothetical protein